MDLALRHKDLKEKFRNSKELYQVKWVSSSPSHPKILLILNKSGK